MNSFYETLDTTRFLRHSISLEGQHSTNRVTVYNNGKQILTKQSPEVVVTSNGPPRVDCRAFDSKKRKEIEEKDKRHFIENR